MRPWIRSSAASRDHGSLAGHLLYDSYDPEGGIFIHRDGSLGVVWQIEMKDSELAAPAELEAFSSRLSDLFRHLPEGSAVQFLLRAGRSEVGEELGRLCPHREAGGSALGELLRGHARHLESLSIPHGGTTYVARTFRVYLTLRVFPQYGRSLVDLRGGYLRERSRLSGQARAVENALTQIGMSFRRMEADAVKGLLYRILNPERARESPPRGFLPDLPLRDQVVRSAARFDYDRGVLQIDGIFLRVLSMVQVPEGTSPGMLFGGASSAGAGVLDLIPEATLAFNIGVLEDGSARRRLERRDAFAWRQLQGPRRKLELVRIKEDAQGALGELLNGRRALAVRFHAILSASTREGVLEKSRAVLSAIDRLGIEMVEEGALGLTLFLQCLPMMYDPEGDRGLKRLATLLSSNVADLLPLYGAFGGTKTPEVLLQNRRGEPVGFSLFDSDVAPHAVVTGVSGAGKSFVMNYMLASFAHRGGRIIVLDRGNSYRNLCELVRGQYVRLDPDRPLRINPVGRAEAMDRERLLFVKDILAEMCSQGEEPVRKEERAVLENAVLRAVGRKGRGEVTLSEVYEALLEEARTGPRTLARDLDRLVLSLRPFVGNGAYAGYFDGPGEIDFSREFSVYELGEIALRKELAPALLMAILYNAATFASAPANLGFRKYLVVDEAWTLLQSPATSRFLENALRTYRKFNAAAILVTQQAADFAGPAGTAIRANAPNRIFLRQTAETVQAMEKLFDLAPPVKAALSGLTTVKGSFSEMLIETPSVRGVARLVPSPGLYMAFSTDGDDRSRLLGLVEERRAAGDPEPLLGAILEAAGGAPPGRGRD